MGVKSTIRLTRDAAEALHVELVAQDQEISRRLRITKQLAYVRPEGGFDLPHMTEDMIVEAYVYIDSLLHPESDRDETAGNGKYMTDRGLAERLEILNDRVNGGEGFENYMIGDADDDTFIYP